MRAFEKWQYELRYSLSVQSKPIVLAHFATKLITKIVVGFVAYYCSPIPCHELEANAAYGSYFQRFGDGIDFFAQVADVNIDRV